MSRSPYQTPAGRNHSLPAQGNCKGPTTKCSVKASRRPMPLLTWHYPVADQRHRNVPVTSGDRGDEEAQPCGPLSWWQLRRTRVTDIVEYITNAKWKWPGHIALMNDNRRTIASTMWQIKGARSVGKPNCRWRDDVVGQQGTVWTGTAKDRVGGLWGGLGLGAVDGHSLEYNTIRYDTIQYLCNYLLHIFFHSFTSLQD